MVRVVSPHTTQHNTTSHSHEEDRSDGEKRVEEATKGEEEWTKREGDKREEKEEEEKGREYWERERETSHTTLTLISKSSSHTSSKIVK
jgi:hypothetical protein